MNQTTAFTTASKQQTVDGIHNCLHSKLW